MRVSEIRVKRIRVNQGLGVWQKKILLLQQKLRDKHSEGIQIAKKILKPMFFFQNCKCEFFAKSTFASVVKMALYLLRHCLMHNAKR